MVHRLSVRCLVLPVEYCSIHLHGEKILDAVANRRSNEGTSSAWTTWTLRCAVFYDSVHRFRRLRSQLTHEVGFRLSGFSCTAARRRQRRSPGSVDGGWEIVRKSLLARI